MLFFWIFFVFPTVQHNSESDLNLTRKIWNVACILWEIIPKLLQKLRRAQQQQVLVAIFVKLPKQSKSSRPKRNFHFDRKHPKNG